MNDFDRWYDRYAAGIEQEATAFRRLDPELLKTIPGEFAAIYQEQLVDHDVDQLVLFQRSRQLFRANPC